FAALFPVGVFIARDRDRLSSAVFWLALLCAGVCVIGILQVVLGGTFLNPQVTDPALAHLTVLKTVGSQFVLRPSGPFADVSRFASLTIVAVLLGFCSLRLSTSEGRRQLSTVAILLSLAGAFASGSRTSLLVCLPLAVFGVVTSDSFGRVRRFPVAPGIAALAVLAFGHGVIANTSATTADFYATTLNPASHAFEAGFRLQTYASDALRGVLDGGLTGRGTGDQSTGRQYVAGIDLSAGPNTESGWGSVAIEWGLVGLVVWSYWAIAWTAKSIRLARQGDDRPARPIAGLLAFYIAALLIALFALGSGFFENYIANIFFWLFSGMAFCPAPTGVSDDVPILNDPLVYQNAENPPRLRMRA
ncbi:MAG: hypothetical protein QOK28_1649, partial [Actinomycetota bacterium]